MDAKRSFFYGWACPVMAAIALTFGLNTTSATPVCDDNGGLSPYICVDKDGVPAVHGQDFVRDFTDPANPDITLITGNLDWQVWSQNAFNFPTAANLGGVKIDPSLDSDNFVVTICNPEGFPGARGFGGAVLIDTDPQSTWTGYSSLPQVVVSNDLTGDITVRESGGNGGALDLEVGTIATGHIQEGVTVTADKLSNLSVTGNLHGAINIVDMLPGAELRIERKVTSTGSITISGNAELVKVEDNVEGTVSIGTIAPTGYLSVGEVSGGPERVVISSANLTETGAILVNESHGLVIVAGDVFGSITVNNITGPGGFVFEIIGTTHENAVITIGDINPVGLIAALICDQNCPNPNPPAPCCEFNGALILESGIPPDFGLSFHGPIRDKPGHDAFDFNGQDLQGLLEFPGGNGRIVNIGEISGTMNAADGLTVLDFTGHIEVGSLAGAITTFSPHNLGGTVSISGDVTATGAINPGASLDASISVGGDMSGLITSVDDMSGEILVTGLVDGTIDIGGAFSGNICAANVPPGGPLPSNITVGSIDDDPVTGAKLCGVSIGCLVNSDCTEDPDDPGTADLYDLNRCWHPCNGTGSPAVCAPVAATRLYHTTQNNRYLTFDPNNNVNGVALEVELTAGPGALVVLGWVGAPDPTSGVSRIVDDPHFATAWPGVIQLADCGIVPGATYDIRATDDETNFSLPLTISTTAVPVAPFHWADVVGPVDPATGLWTDPNGVTNFMDVQASLLAFAGVWQGSDVSWLDVHPQCPSRRSVFERLERRSDRHVVGRQPLYRRGRGVRDRRDLRRRQRMYRRRLRDLCLSEHEQLLRRCQRLHVG